MLTNTGRDLPIEQINKSNYEVPQGEEKVYHALIEVKKFDSNTGDRQSIPRIQKFGSKSFKVLQKNLKKQGYTVEILHDPTEYLQKQNAAKQVTASQRALAAKQIEEERKTKELEELKAQLRQELLDELKKEQKAAAKAETKTEAKVEPKKEEEKPVAKPGALPTK